MQIIICEDEPQFQKAIGSKIEAWQQKTNYTNINVQYFSSSEDFLEVWEKGIKADILFLDILFNNEMDGMALAKIIRKTDEALPIVFITNSEAYIKEGYAVHAFRYLNKPICYNDIAQCLDVAYKQHTIAHNEYLILTSTGQRLALRYEDIMYIEAQSPYTVIHVQGKAEPIQIRLRFRELLPKIPEEQFVMCHRSYVVNVLHIRRIIRKELSLSNGMTLPLSRTCIDAVNKAFDSYYQDGGVYIHVGSF